MSLMRANQTCPEWARLSGNKLRYCEWVRTNGLFLIAIFSVLHIKPT